MPRAKTRNATNSNLPSIASRNRILSSPTRDKFVPSWPTTQHLREPEADGDACPTLRLRFWSPVSIHSIHAVPLWYETSARPVLKLDMVQIRSCICELPDCTCDPGTPSASIFSFDMPEQILHATVRVASVSACIVAASRRAARKKQNVERRT